MKKVKQMKQNIAWGFLAVFLVGVLALAGITYAYRGDPSVQGPNYDEDVHAQIEAAMDAGDYDAWLKIRQDNNLPMTGRMFQVVNKDNFAKYVQMHDAQESGDVETANAIRAELGLGQGRMQGRSGASAGTGVGGRGMRQSGSASGCGCSGAVVN